MVSQDNRLVKEKIAQREGAVAKGREQEVLGDEEENWGGCL